MDKWPFDQPPNCAVISLKQIVEEGQPILHVTHDEDDHGWQFLTFDDVNEGDGKVVLFKNIVKLDDSLIELADIPPGWHAYRRSINDEWIIEEYK